MRKIALVLSLILIGTSQAKAEDGITTDTTKVNYSEYYDVKPAEPIKTENIEPIKTEETQTSKAEESKPATEGLQEQGFKPITDETNTKIETNTSKEITSNPSTIEVNIKNEYPEGVRVVFQDLNDSIELYLNAYETISKVTLNSQADYKIKVFNAYNQYLGYINNQGNASGQLNISPFLLLQELIESSPNIKIIDKPETTEQAKTQTESTSEPSVTEDKKKSSSVIIEEANIKDEFSKNKILAEQSLKHMIKVANISSSSVRLDIAEPGEPALGLGWTVPNDLYVPQVLNFQQRPIQISAKANLLLTQISTKDTMHKQANELDTDELGNYVLLISNPPK